MGHKGRFYYLENDRAGENSASPHTYDQIAKRYFCGDNQVIGTSSSRQHITSNYLYLYVRV